MILENLNQHQLKIVQYQAQRQNPKQNLHRLRPKKHQHLYLEFPGLEPLYQDRRIFQEDKKPC